MKVKIKTSHGDMVAKLHEEAAPKTVENFLNYVKQGHYDGTIFHRVIEGFMIQGGGFAPGLEPKSEEENDPIENEASAENAVPNNVGTLAMARTSDPHSATTQFFINTKDNDFLNFESETMYGYGYCVFAELEEGLEVAMEISKVETGSFKGHGDVPKEDVMLESITVID